MKETSLQRYGRRRHTRVRLTFYIAMTLITLLGLVSAGAIIWYALEVLEALRK
jgi:Na+-driven multidrug efflux pump